MNLIKQLRNELAKKLGKTVAEAAADSVDHCAPEAKRVIEKTVEERAKMLLDSDVNGNLFADPNESLVFRSDNPDKPFHIEVEGLSAAWQDIQKNNAPDKVLKDNVQIKVEWTFKF
jgi:hypothetical protein